MNENRVFKKSSQMVTREFEGELVLLPLYKSSKDLNYIYTLNETAASAWELIDGKRTLDEIKEKLLQEFDIDEKRLTSQLDELVTDLRSFKAIE